MSSIKLSPNASGTGEFTIAAPNSNTNRTLTLPDQTGTVLTNAGPFTANASASAGAVTIDASNNVGIGTSSPGARLHVAGGASQVSGSNGVAGITNGNTSGGMKLFAFTAAGTANGYFAIEGYDKEYGRFDSSGNLLVGTTSQLYGEKLNVTNGGASANVSTFYFNTTDDRAAVIVRHAGASGATSRKQMAFLDSAGTERGSISSTGSATSYTTSSDYRLKHDIAPMIGALAKVAALKPVTYKWNVDDSDGEGFIAHELAEVCPHAVTGEKDAVDEQGNPVYQGIDTSFLVATLTAAIQELNAKVAALEARLTSDGPSNGGATQ